MLEHSISNANRYDIRRFKKRHFRVSINRLFERVVQKHRIPEQIVKLLYVGFNAVPNGILSEPFEVLIGVRQRCNLSTLLFILVIDDIFRKNMRKEAELEINLTKTNAMQMRDGNADNCSCNSYGR